jgi:hypothetical protein
MLRFSPNQLNAKRHDAQGRLPTSAITYYVAMLREQGLMKKWDEAVVLLHSDKQVISFVYRPS